LHVRCGVRTVAAIPAVGLLAGSALGLLAPDVPASLGVAVLIACAFAALCAWRRAHASMLAVCVAAGFFAGGDLLATDAWRVAWRPPLRVAFEELARAGRQLAAIEHRAMPEDDEAFAIVEGVLRTDAAPTAAGVSLSLTADGASGDPSKPGGSELGSVTGGILATVVGSLAKDRIDSWRAGRRIRAPIQLRRPSRYLDPGVPDHERALARRGTILVGTVKSGALVEVLERGSPLDEAIGGARAFARHAIAAAVGPWSPRSAAIVAAIVIGDRAGLDDDVPRALQEAGTYHVIAISGGNIAILAGLLLGGFRIAGLLGRAAIAAAIVLLVAYARLVGGGASVDRATLMAVVYFLSRLVDQRSPPLNTLAVVAGLLVATDPLSVADPAFLLTFGATLGIVLVVPTVTTSISFVASAGSVLMPARRALISMLAASIAAEALLFPIGATAFSRVTFAGLALNLVAIPLMGVAQVAGMALVPAALVSARAAALAGYVAHLGADGLVRSATLIDLAPWVTYRVAPPNALVVAAYYAGLAAAVVLWHRRRMVTGSREMRVLRAARHAAALLAAAAAAWILAEPWTLWASRGDGRLRITFIDVGQGDAAFVRFPRGSTLVVDTGGLAFGSSFDVGDRVVAASLRDAGVRRLDTLVLTHGDPDHIGGARSILREFRPRVVWEGIPVPRSEALAALQSDARELAIPWTTVRSGDRRVVDEVEVVVRHPPPEDWERQRVRNDDSIVLELRWRDVSVLVTGDIGRAVERTLVGALPPARLRVVKVPHHGSLTSSASEFVRALAPRAAVFSVGRANHFGHPASEVIQRYREAGAEIFRTDRDGAVTLETDGGHLDIRTFIGREVSIR
jgi:competence protein ComEC